MSDGNSIGRRQLLTAGVAGVVGATAGFLVGRQTGDENLPGAKDESAPRRAGTEFDWSLTIQGGYGWLFTKQDDKTYVKVLALDKDKCMCGAKPHECIDHPMKLFVDTKLTAIDVVDGTAPDPDADGICEWTLGHATFVDLPRMGVTEGRRSPWTDKTVGPTRPDLDELWDDQIWLPERVKANQQVAKFASASLELTDGQLSVRPPENLSARKGVWQYATSGKAWKKALTDVLRFTGRASGSLTISNSVGPRTEKIILTPKEAFLPLWVRNEKNLTPYSPKEGEALKHYARLFTFTDVSCDQVDVPTFSKRGDLPAPQIRPTTEDEYRGLTPGDLCPPLPLEGP